MKLCTKSRTEVHAEPSAPRVRESCARRRILTNAATATPPTTSSYPIHSSDEEDNKRLTILVYTFVTTTIVLLVGDIGLAIKLLIYNCMKTKLSPRPPQCLPLGAVCSKVFSERHSYQPVDSLSLLVVSCHVASSVCHYHVWWARV